MNNFNFSILEGNLVNDPMVESNDPIVVKFEIVNLRQTMVNGEMVEKTLVREIRVEGKLAEVCSKYLKKGSKVLVSGCHDDAYILGKEVNFLSPREI